MFKKIDQISDIHNLVVLNKKKNVPKFSETHKMKYLKCPFKKVRAYFKFIKA